MIKADKKQQTDKPTDGKNRRQPNYITDKQTNRQENPQMDKPADKQQPTKDSKKSETVDVQLCSRGRVEELLGQQSVPMR